MRITVLLTAFLATTCAAQTYTIQNSPTTENLRGLSTPSANVAWASGTHGTYLRSTDGGTTWTAAQVPNADALDFRDVEAFTADLAYLLSAGPGDQSRIYKTTDAGHHWTLQFTNQAPKGFFDCMAFWDPNHGIAVGDPINNKFELIKTNNGGKTWTAIPPQSLPPSINGEGAYAASGTCLTTQGKNNVWFATGGTAARVFHSTNRGKTWQVADTPITHANDSSGIFSITFRDPTHGAIAGGDYKHPDQPAPNLAITEDAGKTWKLAPIQPQSYISAIAMCSMQGRPSQPAPSDAPTQLLTVGSNQAAYTNNPQNPTWQKLWPLNLNSVSFTTAHTALAVGPKGTIIRFTDIH